jgi:hypothetical protein
MPQRISAAERYSGSAQPSDVAEWRSGTAQHISAAEQHSGLAQRNGAAEWRTGTAQQGFEAKQRSGTFAAELSNGTVQ